MDLWTVAFAVVAVFIGVAFAMLALTPPEFKASRFCLWLSAVWLGGTTLMWAIQTDQPPTRRIVIGALVGATIGVLLPESLRLIFRREASQASVLPKEATVTDIPLPASSDTSSAATSTKALTPPGPEGPTFREKVETITIAVGSIRSPRSLAELSSTGASFSPFELPGSTPIHLYVFEGKTYVDVVIYGGDRQPPLEIRRNEFVVRTPAGWDRNFSDKAIEFVDAQQRPVFQMIYETPSRIQINGVFPFRNGVMVANHSAVIMNPTNPMTHLTPIFKYPSWKHAGVYAP